MTDYDDDLTVKLHSPTKIGVKNAEVLTTVSGPIFDAGIENHSDFAPTPSTFCEINDLSFCG